MVKIKPRKELTMDLLKKMVNYYRFDFSEDDYSTFENWECFSHPSFELHECNSRSNLPGNRVCEECKNNVDRPCQISCDIQTFCLAVYAWRLGIGGEDMDKAIQRNLYKKTPDELYNETILVLSCGIEALPKDPVIEEVEVCVEESLEESTVSDQSKKAVKKKDQSLKRDKISAETIEDYYTVSELAKKKNRTYQSIWGLVKDGKISSVEYKGKKYIHKDEARKYTPRVRLS